MLLRPVAILAAVAVGLPLVFLAAQPAPVVIKNPSALAFLCPDHAGMTNTKSISCA